MYVLYCCLSDRLEKHDLITVQSHGWNAALRPRVLGKYHSVVYSGRSYLIQHGFLGLRGGECSLALVSDSYPVFFLLIATTSNKNFLKVQKQ